MATELARQSLPLALRIKNFLPNWEKLTQNPWVLTLELRMSHFCDAGRHPLSAAVTILQQGYHLPCEAKKLSVTLG